MDHAYRVEINRILQQVEKGTKAEDIAQNSYPHIEKLQWLSAEEGSRETASAFFQEGNNLEMACGMERPDRCSSSAQQALHDGTLVFATGS